MAATTGDDILSGTSGADTIDALAGNDSVDGLAGDDNLFGGDDNDTLDGDAGFDTVDGALGNDSLRGGAGIDTYTGGAGDDDFHIDALELGVNDYITDFADGDLIEFGNTSNSQKDPGADLLTFIGTAPFSGVAGEVRYSLGIDFTLIEVDLDGDGASASDHTVKIENGPFALRSTVPNGPTLISANAYGTLGTLDDTYYASMFDDLIDGGTGNDVLWGMEGDDTVGGGDGDDSIQENIGNDSIDGGAGFDQLTHFYGEAIDLTITDSSMTNALSGETDAIANIEQVFVSNRLAPSSNDTLDGALATIELNLHAGAGNDIVIGGSNVDNIEGDNGADTLTGGLSADTFDFDYLSEANSDVIVDLEPLDTVDFATVQFLFLGGDPDGADLTFIGTAAFSGAAGEIRYVNGFYSTQIYIDEDGDAVFDHAINIIDGGFDLVETSADSAELVIVAGSLTAGADDYVGSNAADVISALDGDDTIQALGGDDLIAGDLGGDRILGGDGNDSVNGNDGYDVLEGGTGNDSLYGDEGLDTVFGEAGDDSLTGGVDNDILYGGAGVDALFGEDDNDSLFGEGSDDFLGGGLGSDTLTGGDSFDNLEGGAGADYLDGGADFDVALYFSSGAPILIDLGAGTGAGGEAAGDTLVGVEMIFATFFNDTLIGGAGDEILNGGAGGDDDLRGAGGNDTLIGDVGVDSLTGGAGGDQILGYGGADTAFYDDAAAGVSVNLQTEAGLFDVAQGDTVIGVENLVGGNFDDTLTGDDAPDTLTGHGSADNDLRGGAGDDVLAGLLGADSLHGETGRDALDGGDGNDLLDGGVRQDTLSGGRGFDLMFGGVGDDSMHGGGASDTLWGGDDSDTLNGATGNDSLIGDDGGDLLVGRQGRDALFGGAGGDFLTGRQGADTLNGNGGNDFLTGNGGADTFVFRLDGTYLPVLDTDTIRDFNPASGDVVHLVDFAPIGVTTFADVIAKATDDGSDTTLDFGYGHVLVLQGVLVSELTADDFTFG